MRPLDQQRLAMWTPLSILLLLSRSASAARLPPSELPSVISLRAAVFHAPPFAQVIRDENGDLRFSGFQYDLLRRLVVFAKEDNVTLHWNLTDAPIHYADAFDLVASDCEVGCHQTDLIVANFYATPARAMRAALSPAWLKSTISTLKYKDKSERDFTTLSQASIHNGTVCLKNGTFYADLVRHKYPDLNVFVCDTYEDCMEQLKREQCDLYADDELQLHYRAARDSSLEVTRERFNTQWIVWALSFQLDQVVTLLLQRWLFAATVNGTIDELYFQYFQKALCPVGTAGEHCQLPCDPAHGAADGTGQCVCESTRWTGADCSTEVPEDIHAIPPALKALSYGMLAVNVTVILACAVWLYYCRTSSQVRYAQPFFLLLVLLGCLISSCTILPLAQDDGGNADHAPTSCMAIPWLYSVGFSVTFGTLFAKIHRVYLMFMQAEHRAPTEDVGTSPRRYFVTWQETLCVIGVVLLIDMSILAAWTIVDPLQWKRQVTRQDQFGYPLESEGYCTCEHWVAFVGTIAGLHLLLMAVACYMCYAARHIPTKFSEGKYLSIAMVSNLQIFLVGGPILIIAGTQPETGFFVRSVIIWMNDLAIVSLIFGNLMYSVYTTTPERDLPSSIAKEITSALSGFKHQRQLSASRLLVRSSSANALPVLPLPAPKLEAPEYSESENPDAAGADNLHHQAESQSPPQKRNPPVISSLTMLSFSDNASTCSQNRKSVSWGLAYYSEGGVDEEDGVPIVDTLPIHESSPPEASNRSNRFHAHACQRAPQYKRPTSSPDSSDSEEEFKVRNHGLVMPRRKSSVRGDPMSAHMRASDSSPRFSLQASIPEEDNSDDTDQASEMETPCCNHYLCSPSLYDSEQQDDLQLLHFNTSREAPISMERRVAPVGPSRQTVEASEPQPQKPNRSLIETSSSTQGLHPYLVSTQVMPQKMTSEGGENELYLSRHSLDSTEGVLKEPSWSLTDTSLSSQGPHLQVALQQAMQAMQAMQGDENEMNLSRHTVGPTERAPKMPIRRLTDPTSSSTGGHLDVAKREGENQLNLHTMESTGQAPQTPNRRRTDTSLSAQRPHTNLLLQQVVPLNQTTQGGENQLILSWDTSTANAMEQAPQKPDQRPANPSLSSLGPHLQVGQAVPSTMAEQEAGSELSASRHAVEANEKSNGTLADLALASQGLHLQVVASQLAAPQKHAIEGAGVPHMTMALLVKAGYEAKSPHDAPQRPVRINSSAFLFDSELEDLDDKTTAIGKNESKSFGEGTPSLVASFYSSDENTIDRGDGSDHLVQSGSRERLARSA